MAYPFSLNTEFPTRLQPRPLEWKPRDGILEYSGGYTMPKFNHARKAFTQRITALSASTGLFIPLIYSLIRQTAPAQNSERCDSVVSDFPKNSTLHLYNTAPTGLNCAHSVSRTDRSLGNSLTAADNRNGNNPSGFFICNKSRLNNGGACSGAFNMPLASVVASFLDYKNPATRLGNGLRASKLITTEANHA